MVRTNKFLVLVSIIGESVMTLGFMHHQLADVENELKGLHVSNADGVRNYINAIILKEKEE